MKNFITILCLFVFSSALRSQEKEQMAPKDYTITMDSLFRFVKKDSMKTGLLYDRVIANANLLEFNNKESKQSSNYWHYIQSLSEVHRSSLDPENKMQYEVFEDLKHKNNNVLNIGFINTLIDYVDYGTKEVPNLSFKDGFFFNIEDRNPYKQKQITIVAAIAETIFHQDIKIRLNPDLVYQDDNNPIKNLTAILNGTEIQLVSNFEDSKETIDYRLKGDEKEIIFRMEFKNETRIETRAVINVSLPQVAGGPTTTFPLEENFTENLGIDHDSPENTILFQGYNETTAIKGVLEYRTYYNKVTNDGSSKSLINKPVIILDGFDPGDKRKIYPQSIDYSFDKSSLYESMFFDHDNDTITPKKNFIDYKLRPQGFDVTLVNFPDNKIVHPTQPTRQVWVQTGIITHQIHPFVWPLHNITVTTYHPVGHWTTVTNYLHLADGGADYVERNAMALVALLKRENHKLVENGSAEKITLIGPSMSGLISRYALAYMEKNNIPHNVKLWVSFDSPQLAANIPIATQENIYFFGQYGQKEQAKKKFKENFANPFARQILIEQMDYKHQNYNWWDNLDLWFTPGQLGQNNSAPFRARFINELENVNGVQNSNGFPTNVCKIALINGTTNGTKTNSEGQLFLELAGFSPSWLKFVAIEDRNLSTPNSWIQTFSGLIATRTSAPLLSPNLFWNPSVNTSLTFTSGTKNRLNVNPRGSMDVVQGGTFNTQKIIKDEFSPELDQADVEQQWRVFKQHHAFIPTISSLVFKNPNFDWTVALNRNLLCDANNKEIYFDSYFAPSKNEEHVALTNESVNWLLQEINGNAQAPWFDVDIDKLVGLTHLCDNQTESYAFDSDVCKLPSAVVSWEIPSNLELLSSNGFSISVKSIDSGASSITAVFSNGMKVVKPIWIGPPQLEQFTFDSSPHSLCFAAQPINTYYSSQFDINDRIKANFNGQTPAEINLNANWEWQTYDPSIFLFGQRNMRSVCVLQPALTGIRVRTRNICGWSEWSEFPFEIIEIPGGSMRTAQSVYTVSPNPTSDILNIDLRNQVNKPVDKAIISAKLYNMIGEQKATVSVIDNKASIATANLPKGLYILKIDIDGNIENHHVGLQ